VPLQIERRSVQRWALPGALALAFVVVALLAAIGHGSTALHLDRPITDWAVSHRTPSWTGFFRAITNLGNPGLAFVGGLVLAVFAVVRSRWTALLVLLVTIARPVASTIAKTLVDRSRPPVLALVHTTNSSFPSGHVLAATVFWGTIPVVMMVWGAARSFVVTAWVFAGVAVLLVAASRIYLGVHWFTDVLGGAALGALLLVPVLRMRARP
jgi:membrane-associated phospholipid phosphatase